jgi:hypothetical protein
MAVAWLILFCFALLCFGPLDQHCFPASTFPRSAVFRFICLDISTLHAFLVNQWLLFSLSRTISPLLCWGWMQGKMREKGIYGCKINGPGRGSIPLWKPAIFLRVISSAHMIILLLFSLMYYSLSYVCCFHLRPCLVSKNFFSSYHIESLDACMEL